MKLCCTRSRRKFKGELRPGGLKALDGEVKWSRDLGDVKNFPIYINPLLSPF